jgi:hypothetical protein
MVNGAHLAADKHRNVEIDVTDWRQAEDEHIGTKPKQWLFQPAEDPLAAPRWLWKERTWNTSKAGERYPKGDDWAEKVATQLAHFLGIPVPDVQLATKSDLKGTVSLAFTTRETTLQLGNELLVGHDSGYANAHDRADPRYTLEAVMGALETVEPGELSIPLARASDWFAGYLLLDAWIGNTDRHHQNWGALTHGERQPTLAPSFDHASSLGFLLSDQEREERLDLPTDHPRSPESWAEKARTPFAGRPSPLMVARAALKIVGEDVEAYWLQRLEHASQGADGLIASLPDNRMSPVARAFALRLLRHNHTRCHSGA